MKFNSQICTTKEQSARLLALGLKKETADCIWCEVRTLTRGNPIQWFLLPEYVDKCDEKHIPAWSLHRLIEMCNNIQPQMTISIYKDEVSVDGNLFEVYDNTYDNLISIIEWLICLGHFNKQYLEE